MEAVEKTLPYRDDTGLYTKLLPAGDDKAKCPPETTNDEPNYVDLVNLLDMKSEGTKTVKVTFTGDGNQRAVIKCDSRNASDALEHADEVNSDYSGERSQDKRADMTVTGETLPFLDALLMSKVPDDAGVDPDDKARLRTEYEPCHSDTICSTSDDLEYTDMYLNSKSESDDGASAVLSPDPDHESDHVEDESHYITTHEIQLTELDHDVDYDLGRGNWDYEDDNLVYTFVDYALFESDETQEGASVQEDACRPSSKAQPSAAHKYAGGKVVDDLCDSDKCTSSDESVCKSEAATKTHGRQIHLSIKPSPPGDRSGDVPGGNGNVCGHAEHAGYRGRLFRHVDPRRDGLCDFIPAPGRQHLATKLRWKNAPHEYSSGASSSISELDDADKEVRNLTAKSFRSLACPYFDAINLSTSSESSVSEYGLQGLNKWSAYVNLNNGNVSQRRERGVFARKSATSSATFSLNKTSRGKKDECVCDQKERQVKARAANQEVDTSKQGASTARQVGREAQPQWEDVITLTETINFHVEAELPDGRRRASRCSRNAHGSRTRDGVATGHKRAIFASSYLKNVISKKMQFEQERKMERGDYSARSPCFQCREQDAMKANNGQGKSLHRQGSESGSEFTVNSLEINETAHEGAGPRSRETSDEHKRRASSEDARLSERGSVRKANSVEAPKSQLNRSQPSAFTLLRCEEEQGLQEEVGNKLSQLFVPSSLLLSKEKDSADGSAHADQRREEGREDGEKAAKPPEIKIRLRYEKKENKGHMLNIANLLTPKISNTVKTLKPAGYPRFQVLSAPDRIPHFTVRDMRENKCKFQTPIYHVRDVRKLVKSSYHFVSADNGDNRCSAADARDDKSKHESTKGTSPSPIVIKCNSIKTKCDVKQASSQQKSAEAGGVESGNPNSQLASESSSSSSHWTGSKGPPVLAKQINPDQSESQTIVEGKTSKQRQEWLTGDPTDRKAEPKVPNQGALEKLQAAVKTMEQLYVFDRNEWKRKSLTPQPVSNSHVLPLIARREIRAEEPGGPRPGDPEATAEGRVPRASTDAPTSEASGDGGDKGPPETTRVPVSRDPLRAPSQESKTYCKKSVLHLDNGDKRSAGVRPQNGDPLQHARSQTSCTLRSAVSESRGTPRSLKISVPNDGRADTVASLNVDPGNYLTIPRQGYTSEMKVPQREQAPPSAKGDSNVIKPKTGDARRAETTARGSKTSPFIIQPHSLQSPPPTAFHPSPASAPRRQLLRLSPASPSPSPSPGGEPPPQQTQRKMLLDITTGHYYLVDTPVQPATKRLYDPETGQFVDVPVTSSPVASAFGPVSPASPLASGQPAYAPAYVVYPGSIHSPALPARAEGLGGPVDVGGLSGKHGHCGKAREAGTAGAESPYYSATGGPLRAPGVAGRGGAAAAARERKPVISITTQQGPRIIAPPSFDGTTMSFVVEHR